MRELEEKRIVNLSAGELLFQHGEEAIWFAAILKGTIRVQGAYTSFELGEGDIVGILEKGNDTYQFDYMAWGSVKVLPFSMAKLDAFFDEHFRDKNYAAKAALSVFKQIHTLCDVDMPLHQIGTMLENTLKNGYQRYLELCKVCKLAPKINQDIENMEVEFSMGTVDDELEWYYAELLYVAPNRMADFFSGSVRIPKMLVSQALDFAKEMQRQYQAYQKELDAKLELLGGKGAGSLFACYYALVLELQKSNGDNTAIVDELDMILKTLEEMEQMYSMDLHVHKKLKSDRFIDIRNSILTKSYDEREESSKELLLHYSSNEIENATNHLKDTLKIILNYAGYSQEEKASFQRQLMAFRMAKENDFRGNDSYQIIKQIGKEYYQLYEKVFFHMLSDSNVPEAIYFFLDYGILDEKMFEEQVLVEFYYAVKNTKTEPTDYGMYTMSQWLRAIYEGKREPSRNEFDMDYAEYFREMKKSRQFTKQEEDAYFADQKGKVQFEIQNMFRLSNRSVTEHITTAVPFVYQDEFIQGMVNQVLSIQKLKECFDEIQAVDYSLFYRETVYQNDACKIERERIQVKVLPDFILTPNLGNKGIMWQEISGRKRTSAARFVFPAYVTGNLQEICLKVAGKFRWELCRTIQGVYWNDISDKSLTAEYCDYAQFYRTNRELSESVKAKIKEKLKQCRNNYCDMFITDYLKWIQLEAKGSSRLNKVNREILATYCPFSVAVRESLRDNPMFGQMVQRFEMKQRKKAKELQNRYVTLKNQGAKLTRELEENLVFYTM